MLVGLLFCSLHPSLTSAAMKLQAYAPANHDRFYTGSDRDFIGEPFDWSGVGRGPRWLTMISPSYFLGAIHTGWQNGDGSTVRFYESNDVDGEFQEYVVESGTQIANSDLWLGKLQTPVGPEIAINPILFLAGNANYENRLIWTVGRSNTSPTQASMRFGRNHIDPGTIHPTTVGQSTGQTYRFDFDNPGGVGADESYLQGGDSGGPSFSCVQGGTQALVGIHWFIDADPNVDFSGDTFVPFYVAALDLAMEDESVTTVSLPEYIPGDMDFDGDRDFDDIPSFVWALSNQASYEQSMCAPRAEHGDLNDDGMMDLDDVAFFIELLTSSGVGSGGVQTVPEPATVTLLAPPLFGLLLARRGRRRKRSRNPNTRSRNT